MLRPLFWHILCSERNILNSSSVIIRLRFFYVCPIFSSRITNTVVVVTGHQLQAHCQGKTGNCCKHWCVQNQTYLTSYVMEPEAVRANGFQLIWLSSLTTLRRRLGPTGYGAHSTMEAPGLELRSRKQSDMVSWLPDFVNGDNSPELSLCIAKYRFYLQCTYFLFFLVPQLNFGLLYNYSNVTGPSTSTSSKSVVLKLGCILKIPGVLLKSWCPDPLPPAPAHQPKESIFGSRSRQPSTSWLQCAVNIERPLIWATWQAAMVELCS